MNKSRLGKTLLTLVVLLGIGAVHLFVLSSKSNANDALPPVAEGVERSLMGEGQYYTEWFYRYRDADVDYAGYLTCTQGWCDGKEGELLGCKFSNGNLVCSGNMKDEHEAVWFVFRIDDSGDLYSYSSSGGDISAVEVTGE